MKLKHIIDYIEDWAPKSLIDTWDNTGFQIGSEKKDIKSILIGLDLDEDILKKAIEDKFDLIITHHPIIFKPLKNIISTNPKEKLILDIIKNDIAVYNAHSNLDLAIGGVNDELAKLLNIKNTINLKEIFKREINGESISYGYGRIGEISETGLEEFIGVIKSSLNIENLILYGSIHKTIRKVAVCGGSGSDFIENAIEGKADLYITADIKYHEAQDAYERGLTLIDVGHFHSEKIILPVIKRYLEKEFKTLNIEVVMQQSLPKKIY